MDDPLLLLEGRIMVSGRCVDCYYPAVVVDIMMSSSNPYHICRQKGLVLDYTFCFLLASTSIKYGEHIKTIKN